MDRIGVPVTITNGTALSPAIDIMGYKLTGIQFPAAWTAAAVTFQGSADGQTYTDLYDSAGVEVSYAGSAASRMVLVNQPHQCQFPRFIKIRSGTSGTPVNQAADRLLTVTGASD